MAIHVPEGHATNGSDADSDPGCVIRLTVVISAGQPNVTIGDGVAARADPLIDQWKR